MIAATKRMMAVGVVGVMGLVGGLAGCSSPPVDIHPELADWIDIDKPVVERGDILKVTVPVRLMSDPGEYSRIQYKFMFFDDKGVPLRVQPDFQFMRLEPRIQAFLKGNATDDTATEWRLEIRPGR